MTKIKENFRGVKNEVRKRTMGYILAALGLVAGLAWNDAIKACIEYFFPQDQNSLKAKLIYALIITSIVAVISFYFARLDNKQEEKTK